MCHIDQMRGLETVCTKCSSTLLNKCRNIPCSWPVSESLSYSQLLKGDSMYLQSAHANWIKNDTLPNTLVVKLPIRWLLENVS